MYQPPIIINFQRIGHLHRLPPRPFQGAVLDELIIVVIERLQDHRTTSQFDTSTTPFTI